MTGWDACTREQSSVLRWFECHPGSAGWAQVIGTLIAIGFAYWLGRMQVRAARQLEKQKRDTKARALALLFAPRLADAVLETKRIKEVIANDECGLALITPSAPTIDRAVDVMTFHVLDAEELLLRIDALPVETANLVVRLFNFIDDFNGYVAEFLPQTRGYGDEFKREFIEDVHAKFAGIENLIEPVKKSLDAVTG